MKRNIETTIFLFFVVTSVFCAYISFKIPAIQLIRSEFVFEYGVDTIPTDINYYAYANDVVAEYAVLDFSEVHDKVGEYRAKIIYQDQDYPFKIIIKDTQKPVVVYKGVEFYFAPRTIIKAEDLVESVTDSSETKAYFINDDQELQQQIVYDRIGSYIQKIVVEDEQGNRSASFRVKINIGYQRIRPTISGVDETTISVLEYFDAREGVTATDSNGNDLTDRIRLLKNDVDIAKPGVYEIIYYVVDDNGSSRQVSRRVIVK